MKHLKKILFVLLMIFWVFQIVHSSPLGVVSIDVASENTLEVVLSDNPNLEVGMIDAEITILNDVRLRWGFLNEETSNQVELLLEDPIEPNTNYSLLTVLGSEGNIDFTTPESIEGYSEDNILSSEDQNITSIEIVDDRTIIISYIQDLTSSTYEFKLLSESTITSIEKPSFDDPKLVITVQPPFTWGNDYILMFIEMQDVDGNYLEFDTGIYDFSIPEDENKQEVIENVEETGTGDTMEDDIIVDGSEENMGEWSEQSFQEELSEDELTEMASAGEETLSDDLTTGTGDIDSVALSAETTPDTGAETWVLIMLTLIINTFYYSARRKRPQVS